MSFLVVQAQLAIAAAKVIRHLNDQFNVIGVAGGRRYEKTAQLATENCRYASINSRRIF